MDGMEQFLSETFSPEVLRGAKFQYALAQARAEGEAKGRREGIEAALEAIRSVDGYNYHPDSGSVARSVSSALVNANQAIRALLEAGEGEG